MKAILTEIVDRLSDLGASLDALEAELIANGVVRTDSISRRFAAHMSSVESDLFRVRSMIAQLPE
jgi:hypothetical protein